VKLFMNKKIYPLYSALLASLVFVLGLSFIGIIGFGNKIILFGDLESQYIPFIKMFIRAITGREDYWYSFSNYYGSGTALTYAYYCINPFNLIYIFDWIPESVSTIILITAKIALAAATFQFFESNALKIDSPIGIPFSICYTLGGFTSAMYTNIMWLDAIYILPIITYLTMKATGGLPEARDNHKDFPYISLTLSFAYLFLTNFYMAFMVGIFESAVFILSSFRQPTDNFIKRSLLNAVKYATTVVLAAALSAAVLLPAAYFLFSHKAEDNQIFDGLFATIPDIINSLFIGSFSGLDNDTPFLYSSLPILLLAPFFFTATSVTFKEKVLTAITLIYFLLCMILLPLYEFMHAFDYPNWYAYRFSFCLSFVLCAMGVVTIQNAKGINKKAYIIYTSSLTILYSIMIPLCALRYPSHQTGNTGSIMFINTAFLSVYLLLFLLNKKSSSKRAVHTLSIVFSIILVTEILVNFYITQSKRGELITELAEEQWLTEQDAVSSIKSKDPGFYRISVLNQSNSNAPSWFGYPGLNTFSSSDDYNLRHALYNLGVYTTNRAIFEAGYTPITYALSGTKYRIIAYSERYELEHSPETISSNELFQPVIEELDTCLPIIFMADDDIQNYQAGTDPFINQERLMSCITGTNQHFFYTIDYNDLLTGSYNAEIEINPQVVLFTPQGTLSDSIFYAFIRPHDEDSIFYGCFYQDEAESVMLTMYVVCAPEGWWETAELKRGGIVSGDTLPKGNYYIFDQIDNNLDYDEIAIYSDKPEVKVGSCRTMYFYSYPKDNNLKEICDDLTSTAPEITSFRSSDIKATVNVTTDRPVLFTTIPFDEDWKIYCDGKEVETISTVEDAFLGAILPVGQHDIELKYTARFAPEGKIISTVAAIVLTVIILARFIRRKKDYISNFLTSSRNSS